MRWTKTATPNDGYRRHFRLLFPIRLDNGLRVLWELVYSRTKITREWGGMGADGCEGVTEYFDRNWKPLGSVVWKS